MPRVTEVWCALVETYRRRLRHEVWNVGVEDAPIAAFLTPGARPPVRWLPEPPRGAFVADPCQHRRNRGPRLRNRRPRAHRARRAPCGRCPPRPGALIGIGAGSVVIDDVPPHVTVKGVPARP